MQVTGFSFHVQCCLSLCLYNVFLYETLFFHDSLFCKLDILVLECHMVEVNFTGFSPAVAAACIGDKIVGRKHGMRLGKVSIGSEMKPVTTIFTKPYAIQLFKQLLSQD